MISKIHYLLYMMFKSLTKYKYYGTGVPKISSFWFNCLTCLSVYMIENTSKHFFRVFQLQCPLLENKNIHKILIIFISSNTKILSKRLIKRANYPTPDSSGHGEELV